MQRVGMGLKLLGEREDWGKFEHETLSSCTISMPQESAIYHRPRLLEKGLALRV